MDAREWSRFKRMITPGAMTAEDRERAIRAYQERAKAAEPLRQPTGLRVSRKGGRLIIEGVDTDASGRPIPLPAELERALRQGRAERVMPGPPRCYLCGQFVGKPPTGRPRKFCNEACRSQWRRDRDKEGRQE